VEFGFIPQPPEEPGEDWSVIGEPGNYICFWPHPPAVPAWCVPYTSPIRRCTAPPEVFPLMSSSPLDRHRFLAATLGELMGATATHADAPSLFEVA
jgi:hypothetical protein